MILEEMIAQVTAAQIQTVLDACIKRYSDCFRTMKSTVSRSQKKGIETHTLTTPLVCCKALKILSNSKTQVTSAKMSPAFYSILASSCSRDAGLRSAGAISKIV